MSTDDRSEIHRGPCRCGQGEFVVVHCVPDHPWPTKSEGWETEITCEACRREYGIVVRDNDVVVVRTVHLEEERRLEEEWSRIHREISRRPEVPALLDRLVEKVQAAKSRAALRRELIDATGNSRIGNDSTFARNLKKAGSLRKYLGGIVSDHDLPRIAKYVGQSVPEVEQALRQADEIWKRAREPLPTEGPPLCRPRGGPVG